MFESKKLESLKIIEIPYSDVNWHTVPGHPEIPVFSDVHPTPETRELYDYRLCGVYHTANVPFELSTIKYPYDKYPEGTDPTIYKTFSRLISKEVEDGIKSGKCVAVVGGNCAHAVPISGGIQRALGEDAKVGLIWLDGHGDMNTPETTFSGILGGQPLATCCGLCHSDWAQDCGLIKPYDTENIILSDDRDPSPDTSREVINIKKTNMVRLSTVEFCNSETWKKSVDDLAARVDAIYFHIDGDILDASFVPSHASRISHGPSLKKLLENIKTVMDTGKVLVFAAVSFYFDYGPLDEDVVRLDQDITTLNGMRTVGTCFANWEKTVCVND
mgnify:CR=1 FL=1